MKVSSELRKMAENLGHTKVAVKWSKGHFEAVAKIIANLKNNEAKKSAAVQFAKLFLGESPNFRTKQFLTVSDVPNVSKVLEEIEGTEE